MDDTIKLPAPANKIVSDLIDKISGITPRFVDGVYLIGSLSLNDFYSKKSDIDFLVLCKELPNEETASQLEQIHKIIKKQYPKPELSGFYLASDSIQTDTFEEIKVLTFHDGSLRYGMFDMAPISLLELKLNALTMLGQKAETLPIVINDNYISDFLHDNINAYWTKWINRHSSFFSRKILLFLVPRFTEWSILGVARQLYTLQTGKVFSKTEAGFYCLENLPSDFRPIILDALKIRKDNQSYPVVGSYAINPSFRRLKATIKCVNFMITLFNKIYHDKHQHNPVN